MTQHSISDHKKSKESVAISIAFMSLTLSGGPCEANTFSWAMYGPREIIIKKRSTVSTATRRLFYLILIILTLLVAGKYTFFL